MKRRLTAIVLSIPLLGAVGNTVDMMYEAEKHHHTDPYINNYRSDFFKRGLIPFYTLVKNRVYDSYRPDFNCP